jgi:hypothetical protein
LECKSVQKVTLSGEYDGTRDGTVSEQLGTTGGTAKMTVTGLPIRSIHSSAIMLDRFRVRTALAG